MSDHDDDITTPLNGYPVPQSGEPNANEGESIPWMADSQTHLSDLEPQLPPPPAPTQPLPVCDYTTESEQPCEEPAAEKRWSSAAVIISASLGAFVGAAVVSAVLAWALGLVPGSRPLLGLPTTPATTTEQQEQGNKPTTISSNTAAADLSEAVAQKALPSVVNVTIRQTGVNPFTGERVDQKAGNGSGVIIRSDGYILTNNHVVEGADKLVVTVGSQDKVAKVVGTDPSSDLAVIKIEGTGYPAIEVGSSHNLKVGQYVMAVGSPFGFERTVTSGIVSALNRSELIQGQTNLTTYTNLIQTDAAINPGNSGGALVNDKGQLVGINTLIESSSGSSAGIGFAIPVDYAMDIAKQLISGGKALHPYLGVSTETIDQSSAPAQSGVQQGALIRFVQPNSPAQKAGLAQGDIITKIGDTTITSVEDVFAAVRSHAVGDSVTIEVVRNKVSKTFTAILGSDAPTQ